MKIILIEPRGTSKYLHSGLAYITGSLKNKHQFKVYDFNFLNWSEEEIKNQISQFKPDLIGISIKSANLNKALKIAKIAKGVSRAKLIGGGPHITLCGLDFFKNQNYQLFDYGLMGEVEISFVKFCQEYERSEPIYKSIPGLIYWDEDKWQINPLEFPKNLNNLKFPDYSLFEGINFKNLDYPLLTSRGCPYNCIYCSVNKISGRQWRFRSAENILNELKIAKDEYNFSSFSIIDDNFTLDKQRVKDFCLLLLKSSLDLNWSCPNGIRADQLDKEMISIMKRSGCQEVSIGIESGDPRVFDNIKKGEHLVDIKKAIKMFRDEKIRVAGFFIVGLPYDSIKSLKKTLKFIKELDLDATKWNFLIPYPQTELWEWVKTHGRFLRNFTEGQHFSRNNEPIEPVFETKDFSAQQRVRAYKIANLVTGNYRYVFKRPKSKFIYYFKIIIYLLYYSPSTLIEKIEKKLF